MKIQIQHYRAPLRPGPITANQGAITAGTPTVIDLAELQSIGSSSKDHTVGEPPRPAQPGNKFDKVINISLQRTPANLEKFPMEIGPGIFTLANGGLALIDESQLPQPKYPVGLPSERQVPPNVSNEAVASHNIRFMHEGSGLFFHAKNSLFADRPVQLAVAGGPGPVDSATQKFLEQLGRELGPQTGYLTRNGGLSGGLDSTVAKICQQQGAAQLALTTDAQISQPGSSIELEPYWQATPKYSLPSQKSTVEFGALVSNSQLFTGTGDNDCVDEFIRCVENRKPTVLLVDSQAGQPLFDEKSQQILNPSRFLANALNGAGVLSNNSAKATLDRWLQMYAPMSTTEMLKSPQNPAGLVLILEAHDPHAAQKAAQHLRGR